MAPAQLSPSTLFAVFTWNGQQWVPWDGSGSNTSPSGNFGTPLQGMGLYFFADNQWVPWDGTLTGTGGGVTKIIAGTNVSISPTTGVGDVTINASGGGGSTTDFSSQVFMLMGA